MGTHALLGKEEIAAALGELRGWSNVYNRVVVDLVTHDAGGITALDVAKRLMDYGIHPPTIYFPLVVPEALMIEPTETEPKERLDGFVDAMRRIAEEAAESPDLLRDAPHGRPVRRLDEVRAAKQPILRYLFDEHPAPVG